MAREPFAFYIESTPVPASRPRVTRNGQTFYPKRHAQYKEFIDNHLKEFPAIAIDEPVEVRFMFVMPPYKTSDHPVHRADVDNLSKLPMDCMTKADDYWTDDDLIVDLRAFKRFAREGEEPHTQVRIIPIEGTVEDHVEANFLA